MPCLFPERTWTPPCGNRISESGGKVEAINIVKMCRVIETLGQLQERIRADDNYLFTRISIVNLIIIVFNMYLFSSPIVGVLTSIVYVLINSILLGKILDRVLTPEKWLRSVFGAFLLILLMGFCGSVFVILFPQQLTKALSLSILFVLSITISILSHKVKDANKTVTSNSENTIENAGFSRPNTYLLIAFLSLILLGFMILLSSRTYESSLLWYAIPQSYIIVYFIITLIVCLVIFSNYSNKTILFFIVLHCFLLHSYIVAVCGTLYGSDPWGNMGEIRTLLEGRAIISGPPNLSTGFLLALSRALPDAIAVISSHLLQIDIYWFCAWIVPVLWTSFAPLTLFQVGRYVSNDRRYALLLSFAPSLFYTVIVRSSYTVNAGVGFVFLLLPLLFWVNYLVKGGRVPFLVALFVTLANCFDYTLIFIISIEIGIMATLIRMLVRDNKRNIGRSCIVIVLLIPLALIVPLLDTLVGAHFNSVIQNPLEVISRFFLWIIDMFTLNIISGSGILAAFPSLWVASNIIISILMIIGLTNGKKINQRAMILILTLFLVTSLSVFIVAYLMVGPRPLGVYLFSPLDLFKVPLVALGLVTLARSTRLNSAIIMRAGFRTRRFRKPFNMRVAAILVCCIFLAAASTSSYTVDPGTSWVSSDEVAAMTYINENTHARYCVIADAFTLTALQGISANNVTSGNFHSINQPGSLGYYEVEQYLNRMLENVSADVMEEAMDATNSDVSYFVVTHGYYSPELVKTAELVLGLYKHFGNVYIFRWPSEPSPP